ncbi:MAG: site-2 protease family protein [Limisphaerales bacterium]
MTQSAIIEGLLTYLCFIPLLTFHEWAHAWVAWKCGDDTAYHQGRVTLNPVAHMELLGTVILPLVGIFLSLSSSALAGFIIGWGRPVPVNISNLRNPRRDDTLVALAGPAINVLLAFALLALAKIGAMTGVNQLGDVFIRMAILSLFLCFFNLLPIPPLDGSHVLKNLIGMSYETYWKLCQYGFLAVIIAINIPAVRGIVVGATKVTFYTMASVLRLN